MCEVLQQMSDVRLDARLSTLLAEFRRRHLDDDGEPLFILHDDTQSMRRLKTRPRGEEHKDSSAIGGERLGFYEHGQITASSAARSSKTRDRLTPEGLEIFSALFKKKKETETMDLQDMSQVRRAPLNLPSLSPAHALTRPPEPLARARATAG